MKASRRCMVVVRGIVFLLLLVGERVGKWAKIPRCKPPCISFLLQGATPCIQLKPTNGRGESRSR